MPEQDFNHEEALSFQEMRRVALTQAIAKQQEEQEKRPYQGSDPAEITKVLEGTKVSDCGGTDTPQDTLVRKIKKARQDFDVVIQDLRGTPCGPPEIQNSIHYATNAVMWLGMALKALHTPNPYPESKNPESLRIEPTADGLKL